MYLIRFVHTSDKKFYATKITLASFLKIANVMDLLDGFNILKYALGAQHGPLILRLKPLRYHVKSKPDHFISQVCVFVGPGTYTSDKITNKAKLSLIVARDKRFKDEKERAPGPGAYEFSPLYADTLLRGTFNATLNNPVNKKYEDHGLLAGGNQAFLLGI